MGPILGPLVVTGILVNKIKDPEKIRDSKKLFVSRDKNSYANLEREALAILSQISNISSFHSIMDYCINLDEIRKICPGFFEMCFHNFSVPLWCGEDEIESKKKAIKESVKIEAVKFIIFCPRLFNSKIEQSKLKIDFSGFIRIIEEYKREGIKNFYCGKIGASSRYPIPNVGKIEKKERSHYLQDGGAEIQFILDGDEKVYEIALASIVGKYVRELSMLSLHNFFKKDKKDIYPVSGYRDSKTFIFLKGIENQIKELGLDDICLIRKK